MIGPVKDPVGRTRDGGVLRYSEERQIIDAGFVMTDELREQLGELSFGGLTRNGPDCSRPSTPTTPTPSARRSSTVLHARELPAGPGRRHVLPRHARRATTPRCRTTQRASIGLRAVHAYNNHGAFPPRVPAEGPFEAARRRRASDRARPSASRGGPSLYFDLDRATHVEGMPIDEGRALLQSLQDHAEAARAALRARVAAARRADLGQRVGAAQGERRLPGRRAAHVLALHGRGAGPAGVRPASTDRSR